MSTYQEKDIRRAINRVLATSPSFSQDGLADYMGWSYTRLNQQLYTDKNGAGRANLDANVLIAAAQYTRSPELLALLAPAGFTLAPLASHQPKEFMLAVLEANAVDGQLAQVIVEIIADSRITREESIKIRTVVIEWMTTQANKARAALASFAKIGPLVDRPSQGICNLIGRAG